MSFHTQVWVYPDGEPLNAASLRQELTAYLDECALSHDVLRNLIDVCDSPLPTSTLFYLDGWSIRALFAKLAQYLPNASFAVKGSGEGSRDIWCQEYTGGIVTFEAGPFEE